MASFGFFPFFHWIMCFGVVSEKALVLRQFRYIECSFEAIKLIGLIHEIVECVWKQAFLSGIYAHTQHQH